MCRALRLAAPRSAKMKPPTLSRPWAGGRIPRVEPGAFEKSAGRWRGARELVRACVSRLDVEGKAWLAKQMQGGRDEELPGAQPNYFQITLDVEGETSWGLRVSAHACGGSVVVAELAGAVEQAAV